MRDVGRESDRAPGYVEFVTSRLPALRRLAYGVCGDWYQADDLVQTTITQAYVKWSRVRAAADIDKYLRGMLVKAFLSERRRPWSRVDLVDSDVGPPAPGADTGADDRTILWQEIGRLPRRQRAVIVLRFTCDMSIDETATALGCSAGTVKSQTHDALVALRRRLVELSLPTSDQEWSK